MIDKRKKIYKRIKHFFQKTAVFSLMCGGLLIGSLQATPPEVKAPTIEKRVDKLETKTGQLEKRIEKVEEKTNWVSIGKRTITAYSSTVDQCDGDPFTTAYGTQVRDGIIASNEFEKGTILKINGKEYVVEDRMNARYPDRLDIWFSTRQEALNWGIQYLEIYVKN